MKIEGRSTRTIWPAPDGAAVEVIDQTLLPHRFATRRLANVDDAIEALATMIVRGAPLIGAAAAYGLALALREDSDAARPDHECPRENDRAAFDVREGVHQVARDVDEGQSRGVGALAATGAKARRADYGAGAVKAERLHDREA